MPQSFTKVYLHTVFGTKYRRPLIHPDSEEELYATIRNRLFEYGSHAVEIGGTFDHVHLIHSLPRQIALSQLIQNVKAQSSFMMNERGHFVEDFAWQGGYGSFSIDWRNMHQQRQYVRNQRKHHYGDDYGGVVRMTFQQEYLRMLAAYGCEHDPKYLFPNDPTLSSPG